MSINDFDDMTEEASVAKKKKFDFQKFMQQWNTLDDEFSGKTDEEGNPFDIRAVKAFCDKHNLWLVEDNCDALGSQVTIDGEVKMTGTYIYLVLPVNIKVVN